MRKRALLFILPSLVVGLVVGLLIPRRGSVDPKASSSESSARTPKVTEAPPAQDKPAKPPSTRPDALTEAPRVHEDKRVPQRIFLDDLRSAVTAGDKDKLRQLRGVLGEQDLEATYALLAAIPTTLPEEERDHIARKITDLIEKVPGDASSRLLLRSVTTEGLLRSDHWNHVVELLARRKFPEAIPSIESFAFGKGDERRAHAGAALLVYDRDRYLGHILNEIRSAGDSQRFSSFVECLRMAAWHTNKVDIAPALTTLKELFGSTSEWRNRQAICGALEVYASNFRSKEVRQWLIEQYRAITSSRDARHSEFEKKLCQARLESLLERSED